MRIINWIKSLGLGKDQFGQSALQLIEVQIKTGCYWNWKRRQGDINPCCSFYSGIANKQFGIDRGSAINGIIGYIEFLEKENAILKTNRPEELLNADESVFELGNNIYQLAFNAMVLVSDGVYTHKGKIAVINNGTLVYYK